MKAAHRSRELSERLHVPSAARGGTEGEPGPMAHKKDAPRPLAQRLHARFAGLDRAYGHFTPGKKTRARDKKVEGKYTLIKKPLTVEAWEVHVSGKAGLGIIPIRDDSTCRFGAIDEDVYDIDLEQLARRVAELKLPLVTCRSKSGGAHLYLFGSEDLPADLLRTKLMEMAIALGCAGVEIFPKQSRLAGPQDYGNPINMPYFHANVTTRYAIGLKGGQMTLEQFLKAADDVALTEAELRQLAPDAGDTFSDGPPCLQTLAARGFPEGSRNNALFNLGVYLRKSQGEAGWDTELGELNYQYVNPPLPPIEALSTAKSVRKKSYEYKCKEAPIVEACNRQICLTRKFGIRGARNDPGVNFGQIVKIPTEPPVYLWDVNGERLQLTSAQLMDQRRFNQVCFERLDVWPTMLRPVDWQDLIRERLEKIEVTDAPEDASRGGRIWQLLEEWCRSRAHGLSRDELLMKKPWTEGGLTYFRLTDLMDYLEHHRLHNVAERDVWMLLRQRGAEHGRWNVKGQQVKWWSVPQFTDADEALDVPPPKGQSV